MTDGIPITDARREFAELLNRVIYGGERIVLTRRDKPVAAIVSIEDFEMLELMRERRIDLTGTGRPDLIARSPREAGEPHRIAAEYRPPGFRG